MPTNPRFMIIDGNALVHRAYHALPPLMAKDGTVVNAVYGFAMVLMKALKDIEPTYVAVAFDRSEPTFRHERYADYKGTREKKAQDLYDQIPLIQGMLGSFGIVAVDKAGYEADDIIATLSSSAKNTKNTAIKTIILTGDMDTLQLVDNQTEVWSFRKGMSDIAIFDRAAVQEKYGITPEQTIDYKALRGDPSDNIPGVKGIGEKTATELIARFKTIEGVYEALEESDEAEGIKPRIRELLMDQKDVAIESKLLVTLVKNAPIDTDLEHYKRKAVDTIKLTELFNDWGFRSLLKRVEELGKPKQTSLLAPQKIKNATVGLPATIAITTNNGTIGHDLKSYLKQLPVSRRQSPGPFFDTMIASQLVHSGSRDHSLETLVREYGVSDTTPDAALVSLASKMRAAIQKDDLTFVCDSIEMPLIPVLTKMETFGIAVDTAYLKKLTREFGTEIERLEKKIWKLAGVEFNVNSPVQMREVLFEKMHLMPESGRIKKTTRGGVASTAAGELEKLRGLHPIIDEIFAYRELAKLKSTYTDALIELVHAADGRVHTTFNQIGASTGRMSSSNPNLQNIPIRSENGQRIREAFIAAPGYTLVSADYSQIELRVAASMSGDPRMIEAFQSGEDFHAKTAALMFDVATDAVTPNMRRDAKAINFGILYGMGAQSLSVGTGMNRKEADDFIKRYFTIFKTLGDYLEELKNQARSLGYVTTLFGRRRYIPELTSQMQQVRAAGERMAINMPIQGTATGDLMKLAMIKIDADILEGNRDDIRMLLQVHDELVFEVKTSEVKKYAPKIKDLMENVHHFKVPIVADLKSGPNWGEMKKI